VLFIYLSQPQSVGCLGEPQWWSESCFGEPQPQSSASATTSSVASSPSDSAFSSIVLPSMRTYWHVNTNIMTTIVNGDMVCDVMVDDLPVGRITQQQQHQRCNGEV